MAKIKVKDLELGMRLTANVCDRNGRFLLGEGCEISEKHLKALHAWGVISVEISGDELPENPLQNSVSAEDYKIIEEQVKSHLIHNNMNHPFIAELTSESIRYFTEHLRD